MPSTHTRTIAIDLDLANDLNEEALAQTRLSGKKVTTRQVAEAAILDYLTRIKQGREQTASKLSKTKK